MGVVYKMRSEIKGTETFKIDYGSLCIAVSKFQPEVLLKINPPLLFTIVESDKNKLFSSFFSVFDDFLLM